MANSLGDLAKRLFGIADQVDSNADLIVKEVATMVAPLLVYGTPVDTSRARANWTAAYNSLPTDILYYPHPAAPATPSDGGKEGVHNIDAAVSAYKHGGYIGIANNVPYINKLNNGYSSQAPANFVQIAILSGIKSLNGKVLLVKR